MRLFPPVVALLLCVATACFLAVNAVAQERELPLETTAAVRQQHAAEYPARDRARVRGVVTFIFPPPGLVYLQDETGGVCVVGTRNRQLRSDLKVGDVLDASGLLLPGEMAPLINGAHYKFGKVTKVGEGTLPEPKRVTIAELAKAENHGVLVEVPGIVRAMHSERGFNAVTVTIAVGRDRVDAVVYPPRANKLPTQMIGAQVRVTGVFNTAYVDRQQVFAHRLLVPSYKNVVVEAPASAPWDLPVTTLARSAEEGDTLDTAALGTRVRVQGTVTLPIPGRGMYLQSTDGAVAVNSSQEETVAIGDSIEAVGFISRRGGTTIIEDAVWRSAPKAAMPPPEEITPEQALSGNYDAHLVSMEGLLLESSRLNEGTTLVLQSGNKVFLARFVDPGMARSLNQNSWLRVTGICLNGQLPQLRSQAEAGPRRTFHLLLSGSDAVKVARAPSWWTLRRMLLAFGALLALAAAAFAWVVVLRRRVAKQTGEIREHLARETLYGERVRIARDLHDSLEQDLVGISMQLKATERLLTDPGRARSALHVASAMVRRSQAETHRAVWDLREPIAEGAGLCAALHASLASLAPEGGPEVQIQITGSERPLPPQTESHLLRIASEAVTNARKHSDAAQVHVEVTFEKDEVRISVRDDGQGFDATQLPPPQTGHFGLFGMRERVEKLGGRMQIHSKPGEGTQIEVLAPIDGSAVSIS